jgi:hypothetical protein
MSIASEAGFSMRCAVCQFFLKRSGREGEKDIIRDVKFLGFRSLGDPLMTTATLERFFLSLVIVSFVLGYEGREHIGRQPCEIFIRIM